MPSKCELLWLHFAPYSETLDLDLRPNWESLGFSKVPENVYKEAPNCWVTVVVHTFNPSTEEAEASASLNLRPTWSTERVPGQPGLWRKLSGTATQTLFKPGSLDRITRSGSEQRQC